MSAETVELPSVGAESAARVYRIRTTDFDGREVSVSVLGWELTIEMIDIYREQGHKCRLAEETWVR